MECARDGLRERPPAAQAKLKRVEELLFVETAEPSQRQSPLPEGASEPQDANEFYKWGNPIYVQELDWGITLSKYEFCWVEIAFGPFTPRDCFEKYLSCVRDA